MSSVDTSNFLTSVRASLMKLTFVSWSLIMLLAIQMIVIVWAIPRGFDFTDEAYAYLGFSNPNEIHRVATFYTVIIEQFFGWMGLTIVKVRSLRLILMVLGGLAFSYGLTRWAKHKMKFDRSQQVDLTLFVLVGCLLIHAQGSQSWTYNLTTTLLLECILGIFLYMHAQSVQLSRLNGILFGIIGFLLFLLFATKFSAAILTGGLIFLATLLATKNAKTTIVHFLEIIVGSFIAGLLLFKGELIAWLKAYQETLAFAANLNAGSILSRYKEDLIYTVSSKLVGNLLFILPLVVSLVAIRLVTRKSIKLWISLGAVAIVIYMSYYRDYYLGGPKHYYIFTGLYLVLVVALLLSDFLAIAVRKLRATIGTYEPWLLVIILFAIPLFGAFGTGMLLSIQMIWYAPILFAAIYVLLSNQASITLRLFVIILSVNSALQGISGLVLYPYRINGSLQSETESVASIIPHESVRVNKGTFASIKQFDDLVRSKTRFTAGDPIFSFSPDYFGFIYFIDGNLPGWGWYDEKATAFNCYTLSNSRVDSLSRMIVLAPSYYKPDSVYRQCFATLKIEFPDDYEKIGTVPYFMADLDRTFDVYAPKRTIKR